MKTIHSITPYELSSKEISIGGKPLRVGYSNAKRDLRKLWLLKWLDREEAGGKPNENSGNKRKKETRRKYHYKLSKYSVYYLIRGNYYVTIDNHRYVIRDDEDLSFEICNNLLSNFKDHILFEFFVFPYIEPETLSKSMYVYVVSLIFAYLNNCCKQVDEIVSKIDYAYEQNNGYVTSPLFVWQNIHMTGPDNEELRKFLKSQFKWDWLDNARITKTEDDNTIELSYGMNTARISLDKERKEAVLKFKGRKEYEFFVHKNADKYIVEVPTSRNPEEVYIKSFIRSHMASALKFVASLSTLISDYDPDSLSSIVEKLREDERFMQALSKTREQFDRRCSMIIEKRCNYNNHFCFFKSFT
jgi:hypothetical protein